MGVWEEFDYRKMAAEARAEAERLKAGMDAVRAQKPVGMEERMQRNYRLQILEEEFHEQRALCKFFEQRARERRESTKRRR